MENEKRSVAIYVRVSTSAQADDGYSIDEQIDKLQKYCDVKDWGIFQVYKDPGYSGSNTNRPALNLLVEDAKQHKFDTVLVYKLDRLSRSQKDTLYLIEDVFNRYGIAFISLNENFDTSTAFGKAMIGILSVFAQLEREQITMRMQMGRVGRAKSGKYNGGPRAPFGYNYRNGELSINEIQAPIVRKIYQDYLSGLSMNKLKLKYDAEGHIGRDKPWSLHVLRYLLTNRTYIGEVRYKTEWYIGNHEPIIDRETFDEVQTQMEYRQMKNAADYGNARPFRSKYMLSGLLHCARCGSPLSVNVSRLRDGTRIINYRCIRTKKYYLKTHDLTLADRCDAPSFRKDYLEQEVIRTILTMAYNPDALKKELEGQTDYVEDPTPIQQRLSEIQNAQHRLMDLYAVASMPIETINEKAESLMKEQLSLEEKLKEISRTADSKDTKNLTKLFAKAKRDLGKMDYADQKNLIKQMIKSVVVDDGKLQIQWRFE
ncbi:recombinase family protein [Secundilactobacillus kimchicus]|uniref:recombinase family protein n=1 Tax=Secundilactobacillus kimchicus TaxID=528209 RepID=UPI0024A8C412|nr:recombinase family protein [Secundilactobacillus kimchicus]